MSFKSKLNWALGRFGYQIIKRPTLDRLLASEQQLQAALDRATSSEQLLTTWDADQSTAARIRHDFDESGDENLAETHYARGMAARKAGDDTRAFRHFALANSLVRCFEPVRDELQIMAKETLSSLNQFDDVTQRILKTARAVEMDPWNSDRTSRSKQAWKWLQLIPRSMRMSQPAMRPATG